MFRYCMIVADDDDADDESLVDIIFTLMRDRLVAHVAHSKKPQHVAFFII